MKNPLMKNNVNTNIFKTFIIDVVLFTIINIVLMTIIKNYTERNQTKRNIYYESLDRNKYKILLKNGKVKNNAGDSLQLVGFLNAFI